MAAPRKPQDHKPKDDHNPDSGGFEFTHAGTTYQLANPRDVLKVGWARKHRNQSEINVLFDMLEELADEDALAAVDDMGAAEFEQFQRDLQEFQKAAVGESQAS